MCISTTGDTVFAYWYAVDSLSKFELFQAYLWTRSRKTGHQSWPNNKEAAVRYF